MASLFELTKQKAQAAAISDLKQGKSCDSSRHYARPGSAWDTWYTDQFKAAKMSDYTPCDMEHAETLAKAKLPKMIELYGGQPNDWIVRYAINVQPYIRVSFVHVTDTGHDEYRYSAKPDGLHFIEVSGTLKLS